MRLTVDHDGGSGAASLGHDVAGDAGVVSRVGQSGLGDDEVVVALPLHDALHSDVLLVFQPFHLQGKDEAQRAGCLAGRRSSLNSFDLAATAGIAQTSSWRDVAHP